MIQSEKLKEHARRLRLYNIANRMDSILHHAQEEKPTYSEFLSLVLGTEVEMKERKDYERDDLLRYVCLRKYMILDDI